MRADEGGKRHKLRVASLGIAVANITVEVSASVCLGIDLGHCELAFALGMLQEVIPHFHEFIERVSSYFGHCVHIDTLAHLFELSSCFTE
jgi:hypothetical protein